MPPTAAGSGPSTAPARGRSRDRGNQEEDRMTRVLALLVVATFAAMSLPAGLAYAQAPIESELVLITPVSKFIHDASLKAFADYAKEKWNVSVKTNAIPAGTPVAY